MRSEGAGGEAVVVLVEVAVGAHEATCKAAGKVRIVNEGEMREGTCPHRQLGW